MPDTAEPPGVQRDTLVRAGGGVDRHRDFLFRRDRIAVGIENRRRAGAAEFAQVDPARAVDEQPLARQPAAKRRRAASQHFDHAVIDLHRRRDKIARRIETVVREDREEFVVAVHREMRHGAQSLPGLLPAPVGTEHIDAGVVWIADVNVVMRIGGDAEGLPEIP